MNNFIVHFLVTAVKRKPIENLYKCCRNLGWKKNAGIANGNHKLSLDFISC